MSNVLYRDSDNAMIGYPSGLQCEIKDGLLDHAKSDNWEEVKDLADLLLDLNGWQNNPNLLVVSDNNGMGWSIKEYKGE